MLQPTGRVRLQSGDAELTCSLVPWDSESFGFVVGQVEAIHLRRPEDASELLGRLASWCFEQRIRLVSCRLGHTQLIESMALEDLGFRFIETVYRPRLELDRDLEAPPGGFQIVPAVPADVEPITDIARDAFATGRFMLDSRLDPAISRDRYATWVRRGLHAPGHTLLKVVAEHEIAGFFLVEMADRHVYWHLTALAKGWQGRGLGHAVWKAMLLSHQADGATSVETTISGHNLPALNLYARLGFRFGAAEMTFHWLRHEEHLDVLPGRGSPG